MKVYDIMEVLLSHLRSLFLFVALLVAFIPRIAPWRSMRNCGAFAIASCLVFVQLYACIAERPDMFRGSIALVAIFALYFVCLLIWKPEQISPWTIWQRVVTLVFALAVMLPIWFLSAKTTVKPCRADADESNVIPLEILGLKTLAAGNSNGMVRKVESEYGHSACGAACKREEKFRACENKTLSASRIVAYCAQSSIFTSAKD